MKQDRRTNGWVVIGSMVELILGLVLIGAGAFVSIGGFAYIDKLDRLADLRYVINHKWIKYAVDKLALTPKFVYLYLGIIVAVIGIATVIFAIVSLSYAKKHKVVRRRVALLVYAILSLVVVGGAVAYFVTENKGLSNDIKYVLYGIIGGFGFVALCKLLGVIFGRSEQFMSNDNNKYAVNNRSMPVYQPQSPRPVQAQAVQPARPVQQVRPNQPHANMPNGHPRPVQNRPMNVAGGQPQRPINAGTPQQRPIPRPQGSYPVRPAQANQNQAVRSTPTNMLNSQARPIQRPINTMGNQPQRPVNMGAQPRPIPRPVSNGSNDMAKGNIRCKKCGKLLSPEERFCSRCGFKVGE